MSILAKDVTQQFSADVKLGLSKSFKSLPSKYLYDAHGCALFNKITRHPDYYLTQCEIDILQAAKDDLTDLFSIPFNLIELGPGEGIKSKILIEQFLHAQTNFTYIPIDISYKYLQTLSKNLLHEFPQLQCQTIQADYVNGIELSNTKSSNPNLILFLGSSIGNFTPNETYHFLAQLKKSMHRGDYLLIGFDLRKDIPTLMRAYDDNWGLTRNFNLNLLSRINSELGGNFKLAHFKHYATYNVASSAMESYLISMHPQIIELENGFSCQFDAIEPMHMEYSYKYSISQITELAQQLDFKIVNNFMDARHYFVDSLWIK